MTVKTIKVDYLARVEGEGAFKVVVRDGKVRSAELIIFEPPRFFEAFLRGRAFSEAPDITARICGICPVAYQMSAVHAMENAFGVSVDGPLRDLRRLLYCGEWIESHVLHIYMLHAPDFLGYQGAVDLARDHGDAVRRGLQLKKVGNEIMALLGGREIHPINVRVGGFYKVPRRARPRPFGREAEMGPRCRARNRALGGRVRFSRARPRLRVRGAAPSRRIPVQRRPYRLQPRPRHRRRAVRRSFRGDPCRALDRAAVAAPRRRLLSGGAAGALQPEFRSPARRWRKRRRARSASARSAPIPTAASSCAAIEVVYACDEALRIIEAYREPDRPSVIVEPRAAVGTAATEAPRGLIYHRYRLEADGTIAEARIVPPTSQNQPSIEEDLKEFIVDWLALPDDELRHRCEQTIRNYDPCISCSVHFLRLDMDRG